MATFQVSMYPVGDPASSAYAISVAVIRPPGLIDPISIRRSSPLTLSMVGEILRDLGLQPVPDSQLPTSNQWRVEYQTTSGDSRTLTRIQDEILRALARP
jgi:hypothetical protein